MGLEVRWGSVGLGLTCHLQPLFGLLKTLLQLLGVTVHYACLQCRLTRLEVFYNML